MKRVIPILILLAVAIAAGIRYYPLLIKKPTPVNQLTLSGNIEAHESLVGFKVLGRIVELPVEEGQQVEQGALLARLDDADFAQHVRVDQASVAVRESSLALTLAGTRHQEVKASQQTVLDAEADLEQRNSITSAPRAFMPRTKSRRKTATRRRPRSSAPRPSIRRRSSASTRPSKAAARKTLPSRAPISTKPAPISACRK